MIKMPELSEPLAFPLDLPSSPFLPPFPNDFASLLSLPPPYSALSSLHPPPPSPSFNPPPRLPTPPTHPQGVPPCPVFPTLAPAPAPAEVHSLTTVSPPPAPSPHPILSSAQRSRERRRRYRQMRRQRGQLRYECPLCKGFYKRSAKHILKTHYKSKPYLRSLQQVIDEMRKNRRFIPR